MYYHAIRVSSVAMCNTWVWDASVLFSGLPLMFPFVSLYVPERFLMLDLLCIYVPERFLLFRGFHPHVYVFARLWNTSVCLQNPKRWNRTFRIVLETLMGIIFMNRFYVTYRCGTFWRCLNFGNITKHQTDPWMQSSVYVWLPFLAKDFLEEFRKATKLIPECSHQFMCGCHFWLKIFLENFVLPPSLGPRTYFPSLAYP